MRTTYVKCKDCGAAIATWGGGSNFQHQEEWECPTTFRHTVHGIFRSVNNPKSTCNVQRDEFQIPVKTEFNYCKIIHNTVYCRKCAEKRHFKCGRPKCKGHLIKARDSRGYVPNKK